MERVQTFNPFVKHESHSRASLITYRILSLLTLLVLVAISIGFSLKAPPNGTTIWEQNEAYPTPFSLDLRIIWVYWVLLFALQFGYIYILYVFNTEQVNRAANVGSHFILHNLLQSAFVISWVYSRSYVGEIMLAFNYINLTTLYFRHIRTPRYVHIPVVTAPLTWTLVALFSNGAVMVNADTFGARVAANVAIWFFLLYGFFFLLAFKDYAIGFELSILLLALAVQQIRLQTVALQWIFALVIMGLLLLVTLVFAVPPMFGKELILFSAEDDDDDEDRERQPLLA